MMIEKNVGKKNNTKLDKPKDDSSLKKFSFFPSFIPIERIKRKVQVRETNSHPFFAFCGTIKRPARIPRHIMNKTNIAKPAIIYSTEQEQRKPHIFCVSDFSQTI